MKEKIIPMLIILGFSTFFVDDEKVFIVGSLGQVYL